MEQDATEIRASVQSAIAGCPSGLDARRVAAVGLSNQRESMVLWERATGLPVGPLITWQDGRGVELAERLVASGAADTVRRISGLPLDPMFSALKARWLLDAHDPDRRRSRRGELCLGTVDSWLLSTDGHHVVEVGNASRTQLLDLQSADWSPELLDIFAVPAAALREVLPSDGPFPGTYDLAPVPDGVPVGGVR
jgi:glycerol kinase